MEEKTMQVMKGVKPNVVNWIGALIGAALAWWTGLPPLAQALLIVQGADILTGLLCAVTGKSRKTESGKVSSGALLMGVMKKGLEWLIRLCVRRLSRLICFTRFFRRLPVCAASCSNPSSS